ncbi:MAG: cytochrome c biogenesis protein [Bdellovibrio sp. CG10_big_fil_rev_8_21_14_0_10_47_8]|nr:MAG: cytochrome c biogenesis protein [Bdellovibrio sp. CG10_big_fil_rev_8_21_14_0_10_47_8]
MFRRLVRMFSSVKIAVVILLALAAVTAVGTIIEARYDAHAAAKLVYHTPLMYTIMGALAITLIAVMVDRWPWKSRHVPFLLAHVGILVLLLGSVITMEFGVDGTMRFGIGEKNRWVTVPQTDFQIWSSFDGDRYTQLLSQEVDFFSHRPEKVPFSYPLAEGELKVETYEPYVLPAKKVIASSSTRAGSAVRFQIQNSRVNVTDWLVQTRPGAVASNNFGPAQIFLGPAPAKSTLANELYLDPSQKGDDLKYTVFYRDPSRKTLTGRVKEGGSFDTGWMGLQFRIFRYLPKAEESYEFKTMERPTPLTTSAVKISFQGKSHWIQLNDVLKLFTDNAVYLVTYGNRRLDLGFDLSLKKFEVGRYQGTMRASSYQSVVATPDGVETLISMNEPLKHQGYTFYQASFQDGPTGEPTASILSVNKDPGRPLKYLGSLILSLGIIWLFYNRRKSARAQAPRGGTF